MLNFEFGGVKTKPGELQRGSLQTPQLRNGLSLPIPFLVMHGKHEGPVLGIGAIHHGDEIPGIEVIRRILHEEVKADELRGTIVAVILTNPFAFLSAQNGTPYDWRGNPSLDAAFPGNPKGSLNERLAHRVFNDVIIRTDNYIDLHTNAYYAIEFINIQNSGEHREILDATISMGQAFGLPLCQLPSGGLVYSAHCAGIPALTVELLAHGYFDERSLKIGVLGVKNVLRHLDMLNGEVKPLPNLRVQPGLFSNKMIIANHGGLVHYQKEVGEWIDTGEVIAIVRNVYGDIVEEVKATAQGYVRTLGFGPHNEAVFEGQIIATLLESDPKRNYFYD
jgi:predicted deacylase